MQNRIWQTIASMHTPGFFVAAEMDRMGKIMPVGLERFILGKLEQIHQGLRVRRFVF